MKTNEQFIGVNREVHTLWNLVLDHRMARALNEGVSRLPHLPRAALRRANRARRSARRRRARPGVACRACFYEDVLIDGDGVSSSAKATARPKYCSCSFYIWAADVARAEAAKKCLLGKAGSTRITEPMFRIEWTFVSSHGLRSAWIEELANDVLRDRAYPEIAGGVRTFIDRYLASPEAVLVLQGPPGTGKTRLIRGILGAISRRKGEDAVALYTGDMKALAGDEMFVKFITGRQDAFVIEDADHLLKPRSDGNAHLHRFLTIADGVVRSQGRKIIFSTNLPNVGDLDDALIRPAAASRVYTSAP